MCETNSVHFFKFVDWWGKVFLGFKYQILSRFLSYAFIGESALFKINVTAHLFFEDVESTLLVARSYNAVRDLHQLSMQYNPNNIITSPLI